MYLTEIFQQQPMGYQDISDDNSQIKKTDLRKTRLTLKQINKLRKLNDVRMFEYKSKLDLIKKQYAPAAQPPGL